MSLDDASLSDKAHELFAAFDNDDIADIAAPGRKAARMNPHEVWKKALSQLEMQLPASTFNTWVRDSFVQAYEDGEFIICSNNAYARDWLQNRLRQMIKRILSSIVGRQIQVQFTVQPQRLVDSKGVTNTPLYTIANQEEPEPKLSERESLPFSSMASIPGNSPIHTAGAHTVSRQPFAQTGLKPSYAFDTFVVGKHNQLASAAAMSIVDKPGKRFNPLFVYGGVGLGKTHLLHAVGNRLYQRGFKTLYCTSEQFTNDLITAIRNQSTDDFRNKYRELDVLLIDDIQFIGGKDSTQEEFFHTFNHLFNSGKQVVISSDKLPKSVPTLENRLRSRFEGGLQVDISQPDFETRVAILEAKARDRHFDISLEVLKEIAGRVESNVRELEGALNKLAIQAELFHSHLDVGMARHILQDLNPERKPCTPNQAIEIVARHYRLTADDLLGQRRTKEIAHARHVTMYLLRTIHHLSLPTIGQQLGGRDHTTISHGIEKVEKEQTKDELLRRELILLREKIHNTQLP
ncbi:MAG: chromosomal replication initiator protein DnaA [Caldilineaceae bacterium]